MTQGAAHVLVSAPQREACSLLMIKQRRLPPGAIVALSATGYVGRGELLSVDVFVAVFTDCGRRLEVDVHQPGLEIRRLVAVFAGRGAMSTQQREFCLRVIEGGKFRPGAR